MGGSCTKSTGRYSEVSIFCCLQETRTWKLVVSEPTLSVRKPERRREWSGDFKVCRWFRVLQRGASALLCYSRGGDWLPLLELLLETSIDPCIELARGHSWKPARAIRQRSMALI